ncbi:GNAT family N-acetyltransferase [Kineococcus arenarius]|uniref:GNAT family N-acetyltransferase n=1 Tax=unclassified Kineococcus TaxID=2621656 RepID=UPI003D7E5CEB
MPQHCPDITIRSLTPRDAGELLTLQRAAYVSEAQLYDDPRLPPLLETHQDLLEALSHGHGYAAVHGQRLVGAVRVHEHDSRLDISRLAVTPDLQGRGIGSRLLQAAEDASHARIAALFTGHRSAANLRLYHRHGYTETHREPLSAGITLVHLAKQLRSTPAGDPR